MGATQVKINVVTRRVRLNPDGTRTVIETPSSRTRLIAAAVMVVVGIAQGSYGAWSGRSDIAAAALFRASPDCRLTRIDSAVTTNGAVCRIEQAVVYDRHWHTNNHRISYWLLTVSPQGTRDVTPLWGPSSGTFWHRVKPTDRLLVQRFVAPGYHLTGDITAFGDSTNWVMTRYNPDSQAHYPAVNTFLGATLVVIGLALGMKTVTGKG